MRQSRSRCSPMPMLLSRRKPNHISGMNLINRAALSLNPATSGSHNQSLPQRMRMPRSTRSRFERHAGATNKRRIGSLKERINPHRAGKPLCRTFARRLRTAAFDLHRRHSNGEGRSARGRTLRGIYTASRRSAEKFFLANNGRANRRVHMSRSDLLDLKVLRT
jgi:hypothetical protein